MAKKAPPPKLLFVTWVDAAVYSGWSTTPLESTAHICTSVGWLVKESEQEIVLAGDISNDTLENGLYDTNRRIAIPKAWIKKRKVITNAIR
jgi:hypothetical protein